MPVPIIFNNAISGIAGTVADLTPGNGFWELDAINLTISGYVIQAGATSTFSILDNTNVIFQANIALAAGAASDVGAARELVNLSNLGYIGQFGDLFIKVTVGGIVPTSLIYTYNLKVIDWSQ